MTQLNRSKSLFFIIFFLWLSVFSHTENSINLVLDNITFKFDNNNPIILNATASLEQSKDSIIDNMVFFRLNSKSEEEDLILNQIKYKGVLEDNSVKYYAKTSDIKIELSIYPEGNNILGVDYSITPLKIDTDISKYFFTITPGLSVEKDSKDKYERKIVYLDDKLKEIAIGKALTEKKTSVKWFGFVTQYYAMVIYQRNFSEIILVNYDREVKSQSGEMVKQPTQLLKLFLKETVINKDRTYSDKIRIYAGEKKIEKLDSNEIPEILNLGFFGFFAKQLLVAIKKINEYTNNWGLSIILITLLIRLILYPINLSQSRSMSVIQKLQPEMEQIKKTHAKDPQKMNAEVMNLYKKHNANPLGGCLPILIQIPILFAFFTMLRTSVDIKGVSFLWLSDLSKPDGYYILPIIITISMYYQQKLMPGQNTNPQQKQMMNMMTIFMLFITISMPSGVLVYWFTSNMIGILQQFIINKQVHGGKK
ncbi:MAG: membrane protein insertase YidC [Candidatus Muirbacterium halophilum]|nr:membrane protein insertase YidC [Candidatus Muirbacterium halophilum]MCK9475783.1 membrane protein insertase YidC [Candidatus Muirbacterium halophilum]